MYYILGTFKMEHPSKKSYKLLKTALKLGHPLALHSLGKWHRVQAARRNEKKNKDKGKKKKKSFVSFCFSASSLTNLFFISPLVVLTALMYFHKAFVECNDAHAAFEISTMAPDIKPNKNWLEKASVLGHPRATALLNLAIDEEIRNGASIVAIPRSSLSELNYPELMSKLYFHRAQIENTNQTNSDREHHQYQYESLTHRVVNLDSPMDCHQRIAMRSLILKKNNNGMQLCYSCQSVLTSSRVINYSCQRCNLATYCSLECNQERKNHSQMICNEMRTQKTHYDMYLMQDHRRQRLNMTKEDQEDQPPPKTQQHQYLLLNETDGATSSNNKCIRCAAIILDLNFLSCCGTAICRTCQQKKGHILLVEKQGQCCFCKTPNTSIDIPDTPAVVMAHLLRNAGNGVCHAQTRLGLMILRHELGKEWADRITAARHKALFNHHHPGQSGQSGHEEKQEEKQTPPTTPMAFATTAERAAFWFEFSALQNEPQALYQLGLLRGMKRVSPACGGLNAHLPFESLIIESATYGYAPANEFLKEWVHLLRVKKQNREKHTEQKKMTNKKTRRRRKRRKGKTVKEHDRSPTSVVIF